MTTSASLCPIRKRKGHIEIFLIRRAFWHPTKHRPLRYPGEWAFPGGKRESRDKTLLHTAIREFREELGYQGEIKETFFLRRGRHDSDNTPFYITFYGAVMNPRKLASNEEDIIAIAWKRPKDWLNLITSETFTKNLEKEYQRLGFSDKNYGKFKITKRHKPRENIKTIQMILRQEKELLKE
jgi:8-oxo-dGTP pyrophosphatase MutT (NUDIX family)